MISRGRVFINELLIVQPVTSFSTIYIFTNAFGPSISKTEYYDIEDLTITTENIYL